MNELKQLLGPLVGMKIRCIYYMDFYYGNTAVIRYVHAGKIFVRRDISTVLDNYLIKNEGVTWEYVDTDETSCND